ncbi:alpha/beta hydrolase [Pseudolabrys taiwanensis]|uniref:Alpha/beta hydrolase n=1 Tax=Pseudolabrys taiwanensis TaxID=331696 RepID=A0A345ZX47_9HYPH|nr:alpha/beta fold hydrolase [Pseudolabrys taiwanensis]AXK81494.1 alpha/beta hydrolase [Pseudolabrys taiwanensis]
MEALKTVSQQSLSEASATNSPALHLSPEDWARLSAVNARWNDDIVKNRAVVLEVYSPLVRHPENATIALTRDIAYGTDPRQCLDVFAPPGAEKAPVLVFVHGGAFTRGSKSVNGDIYDNVLYWFARQGFIGVNIEYRLAPAAPFPAGAQDTALAVDWIAANIARYGGDPDRIVLMGHSAGGSHVASYLLDPEIGVTPHPAVKAAILVSARLKLETLPGNPNAKNVAAYAGDDPEALARRSAITHVERCRWPVFIAIAENENRFLDSYGLEFAARLGMVRGAVPHVVQMLGHNHTSTVAHFNTKEEWLGRQLLEFLAPYL